MASHLATAAIGEFRVTTSVHSGRPMVVAVDADLPPGLADDALGRTGEIMDFLAARFGPYPFEAGGGIVDDDPRFTTALETQTRPVYSSALFRDGNPDEETDVVVHQLARQWFGAAVTTATWRDSWLGKAFAAYAEWLWLEHGNRGTPQQIFDWFYSTPLTEDWWARMTVGDAAFDRITRGFFAAHRFANASTAQFVAYAEQVAGRRLDRLLHDWLYTTGKPPYPAA